MVVTISPNVGLNSYNHPSILRPLGGLLGGLGAVLENSWGPKTPPGGPQEALRWRLEFCKCTYKIPACILGPLGGVLGGSWGSLGELLGPQDPPRTPPRGLEMQMLLLPLTPLAKQPSSSVLSFQKLLCEFRYIYMNIYIYVYPHRPAPPPFSHDEMAAMKLITSAGETV